MRRSPRVHAVVWLPLLALGAGAPAAAFEAPLSPESFDRALAEGRACDTTQSVGPYLVVRKKSLEGVLGAILSNAAAYPDTSYSYVTVRLETPYVHVRRLACEAKLWGTALDEAALRKATQEAPIVSVWVETEASFTPGGSLPPADPNSGTSTRTGGPQVHFVYLRSGTSHSAPLVGALSSAGVAYDFPASALQGDGPFYVLIHTEGPPLDREIKLKRSLLAKR